MRSRNVSSDTGTTPGAQHWYHESTPGMPAGPLPATPPELSASEPTPNIDASVSAPSGPDPLSAGTAPAVRQPQWSGRKTAVAAALAIGLSSMVAIGAAAAVPEGSGSSSGDGGRLPGGQFPGRQFPGRQLPGGQLPGGGFSGGQAPGGTQGGQLPGGVQGGQLPNGQGAVGGQLPPVPSTPQVPDSAPGSTSDDSESGSEESVVTT